MDVLPLSNLLIPMFVLLHGFNIASLYASVLKYRWIKGPFLGPQSITINNQEALSWFRGKQQTEKVSKRGVNSAYKDCINIGHLNINSIFGKSDEIINLLNKCAFDILFISESKIDSVSTSLFTHSQYRNIRRDKTKEGVDYLSISDPM